MTYTYLVNFSIYFCSESSMFVSKNRFILKTCGQTTLLKAIEPLMTLSKTKCGMDCVVVDTHFANPIQLCNVATTTYSYYKIKNGSYALPKTRFLLGFVLLAKELYSA